MAKHTVSLQSLGLALDAQGQIEITGLALDNRHIKAGDLFAALPGSAVHGARFAPAAIDAGAVAVLTDAAGVAEISGVDPAKIVIAHDVRASFARAAALFYGGQPKTMVAVTGTNGKTSISSFCRQIWTELEKQAVNIGTTGVEGAFTTPLRHTTPDTLTLHRVLSEAKSAGITHAAMEASSHGLDQRRLDGVRIKAAGFANFTQDHLDYHKTFDAYFQAKAGLFDRVLPDDGTAVINIDDPALNTFAAFKLYCREPNDNGVFRLIGQWGTQGGNPVTYDYPVPLMAPEKSDLRVDVETGASCGCGAIFDVILVDD